MFLEPGSRYALPLVNEVSPASGVDVSPGTKAWPLFQGLRFPYSLGSRGHLLYPLFFFSLNSDFRSYFLPVHTPLLPHFGTSVWRETLLISASAGD